MQASGILVYGHRGWIGSQLVSYFKEHQEISISLGKARVDNITDLNEEVNLFNPTHVICCILHDWRKNESKLKDPLHELYDGLKDNLFAPVSLAILCNKRNIHLTYIGTGCLYEPITGELDETVLPNYKGNEYSVIKGFTDRFYTQFFTNCLNLRMRLPVSESGFKNDLISKLISFPKIVNSTNSITVLPELLPVAVDMILKSVTGTFNFVNPGEITNDEILTLYKEVIDPSFTWKNFSSDQLLEQTGRKISDGLKLSAEKLCKMYPGIKNSKQAVYDVLKMRKNMSLEFEMKTGKSDFEENSKESEEKSDFENSEETILLVTGGCGFIGSNFINSIFYEYSKIKIINIDNLSCSTLENVKKEIRDSPRYKFEMCNLLVAEQVKQIFLGNKINFIIHFAAQSHVDTSYINSIDTTDINVKCTHILLELSRELKSLKKFIFVSTDEVYGESRNGELKTESSLLNPTNPYAASKSGADLLTQSYHHSYKIPTIITRSNNVYGPNQRDKLIPHFIKCLENNKKVPVQGDGNNYRFFIHTSDIVRAFREILKKGQPGEIYNIASDEEFSVMDVAKKLIKKIQNTEAYDEWIEYVNDRPHNDFRYFMSGKYFEKSIGWKAVVKFDDVIDELIKPQNVPFEKIVAQMDCFIYNCDVYSEITAKLEDQMSTLMKTTVINTNGTMLRPHWIDLSGEYYFSGQMAKSFSLFDNEIFFNILADVSYDFIPELIRDAFQDFQKYNWGLYAPNVKDSGWPSHENDIANLDDNLRLVLNPDGLMWFIHKDIINIIKTFNLDFHSINKLGWGIDLILCAISYSLGRPVIRNYGHTAMHKVGCSYDRKEALEGAHRLLGSIPDENIKSIAWDLLNIEKEKVYEIYKQNMKK